MQAAVVDHYGPAENVRVVAMPRPEPGRGEVLVRVHATAVTSADARIRAARFPRGFGLLGRLAFGLRGPRRAVLGGVYSGVVEVLGPGVVDLLPGDLVCGMTGLRLGAHAQYVAVPAAKVARRPAAVRDDDAAGLLFGGLTALYFLRDRAQIGPGDAVLVNGASGAIGTNAVQLARLAGARVTAVTSASNADLVRSLGAQHVIDHTRDDLARLDARFDVVLDAVGNLSIATGRRLLTPRGRLLLAVADLADMVRARGKVAAGTAPERVADAEYLLQRVADGSLRVVNGSSFTLDEIVAAHRLVDTGRKVGNAIVRP